MSRLFKSPLLIGFATGINTIAIAVIQVNVTGETNRLAYSACTPFICNTIVFIIDWFLAKKNVKSSEQLRIENLLDDKISIAQKNLKEAIKYNLDVDTFKQQLTKLMNARANVPALVSRAQNRKRQSDS